MKSLSPSTLESILMTPIIRTSRPGAFSSTAIICVIIAAFALQPYSPIAEARQVALPGPQCHPSVVRSMPERIRKICDALKVIWDFNDSMENYLDEKGNELDQYSQILAAYMKYIYAFCTYNKLSSIEYDIQSHPHFFIAKSPQTKRTLLNVQPPRPTTLRQSQTLKVICLIPTLNRSLPICTSRCCKYLHEKSRW